VLAVAAAVVVVIHHALADAGFPLGDRGADRGDDAARLVAGDHPGFARDAAGDGAGGLRRGAILMEIAAAHTGGLDLEDHVPRAGGGIGKVFQLELAIAEKHDTLHGFLLTKSRAGRFSSAICGMGGNGNVGRRS
jgi:hypothetical protein